MIIGRIMLGYGELAYAVPTKSAVQAESIANMPALQSFGIVTVTLCGRAIGARDKELGRNYIKQILQTAFFSNRSGHGLAHHLPHPIAASVTQPRGG